MGNIDIIYNFVFQYLCSFLLNFHHMMLVDVVLVVNEYSMIIFQDCILYLVYFVIVAFLCCGKLRKNSIGRVDSKLV